MSKDSRTWLSSPGMNGLTPWPCPDAIDSLHTYFVLRPLLQVLDGKLSFQSVRDDVGQNSTLQTSPRVLHSVAH